MKEKSFVRKQIVNSLLLMLEDKSLDQISVKELTQQAQVGRASFYRYFPSLEAVLHSHYQDLMEEWRSSLTHQTITREDLTSLFQHILDNQAFYQVLYQNSQIQFLIDLMQEHSGIGPHTPNQEAYRQSFFSRLCPLWVDLSVDSKRHAGGSTNP